MDKQSVLRAYCFSLDRKIGEAKDSFQAAREGVSEGSATSDSRFATVGFQEGQIAVEASARLSSLRRARQDADFLPSGRLNRPIIGALVTVENNQDKTRAYYLIVPGAGGESFTVDGQEVLAVSISAPILGPISKIRVGDTFEFRGRSLTFSEIS